MSVGQKLCACGNQMHRGSRVCGDCFRGKVHDTAILPEIVTVEQDRTQRRRTADLASLKRRYEEALRTIEARDRALGALNILNQGVETFKIEPRRGSHSSEATAVIVASDWHLEETVGPEVGGLNVANLPIMKTRAERFFTAGHRLVSLLQQDVEISSLVLALLGDFISNDIHEEFSETNGLLPMDALALAEGHLISGIEFLLREFKGKIVLPCHSGNHARTTHQTRFTTENGHSLEYLMYRHLASYFRKEKRLTFVIPAGMHSYLNVYDQTIRFQHGHAIKYGGGVGGIYVPVNKAIAQWSKAKHADLDVFGHFHQMIDGGNFICNGSLIGYNAFALSIKASFEKPKQALFLLDKKRGKTCVWPILVD